MKCPQEFVFAANYLADMAHSRSLEFFRGEIGAEVKADTSLVTIADRSVETMMRDAIREWFPDHGIVGEEFPVHNPDAEYQWVLDPIDGTYRFAAGHPQFGTLIALARHRKPILGVIDIPAMDERWSGAHGWPTVHIRQGRRSEVRTRSCIAVKDATVFFCSGIMWRNDPMAVWNGMHGVNRLLDGDSYSYGLLSSGFADVIVDSGMKPWDFMPIVPIIEGAGGRVTDWQGMPLTLDSGIEVVALGDPALLDDVLRRVSAA